METIKEEKKADLEQLLNSLIERGWLPRGEDKIHSCKFDKRENKFMANYTRSGCFKVMYRSLTEICSKSSGLWQFVCKNDMVDKKKIGIYYEMFLEENGIDAKNYRPFSLVERLIIESSLKDESGLEDFLLSNIVIKENENGTR